MTGGHFQYNLSTRGFPPTLANSYFWDVVVFVCNKTASSCDLGSSNVRGVEDARLEVK
jgi:hypothetical protein